MTPAVQTPLSQWHLQNGAHMGTFGGYAMPLWYPAGARKEHLAVVTTAGLFDTSHMSVITLSGRDTYDLLQYCFSKDLRIVKGTARTPLPTGKCAYGVFLDERGWVIDDAIVYVRQAEEYMVVVNAGMGRVVCDHLKRHQKGGDVRLEDHTNRLAKLDLQGPSSARVLLQALDQPAAVLETFPYFSFKGSLAGGPITNGDVRLTDGTPILLSRTGYTGEFGFEIFVPPEVVENVWRALLKPVGDLTVIPCGLAARDSLRVGAGLPLSHQDIGAWPFQNNPWSFALPYDQDKTAFTKPFLGGDALERPAFHEFTYAFAGFDLRKVETDQSRVEDAGGRDIGTVLTCATDMAIDRHGDRIYSIASPDKPTDFSPKGLCCGFVKVQSPLSTGDIVTLVDRRRRIRVMITDNIRPNRTARKPIPPMG